MYTARDSKRSGSWEWPVLWRMQDLRKRRCAGSVADRPAAPCMATRFPYGTGLSYEELQKAAQGEAYLKGFGLYNVRLRIHGGIARIETDTEGFSVLLSRRQDVISYLKDLGYTYITLDLEGFRSGSMDVGITG